MISVARPMDLAAHLGARAAARDGVRLDAALIDAFIAVSGDDQAIHRGAEAIAPGGLLLALVPRLLKRAIEVRDFERAMTARIDRVAFRRPARLGETLLLSAEILRVARLGGGAQRRCAVITSCVLSAGADVATLRVADVYWEAE